LRRCFVLYAATFVVLMALDFLFLGILAKRFFFTWQVGDMLAEVRALPAILFYLPTSSAS
jgi:uncharacterized membrane protein